MRLSRFRGIVAAAALALCAGCRSAPRTGAAPDGQTPAPAPASQAAEPPAESRPPAVPDPHWPLVREGHYIRWAGRVWNTRKPQKVWQRGDVGILGQRNGTGTYLGEDRLYDGIVEVEVKFDAGYLAPEGGGKHFLEIMSWIADRSDRRAVGAKPWSRIELAQLGRRPRCVVWNYGPQFDGRAAGLFSIGPAFEADRWYRIRFQWRCGEASNRITIQVDEKAYSSDFALRPQTVGPGRFFLFGHVETTQPAGRMYFRNFRAPARR
jgi:hypothetical protein